MLDKLTKTFWGYKRPDGRVGIRNHVLILPASICASDVTRNVAAQVEGAVTFGHQLGCSQLGSDYQITLDTVAGYAANPNIYGTIIIGLGCENHQAHIVKEAIEKRTNKPIRTLVIQEEGGTLKTTAKAVDMAREMTSEAILQRREEFPVSELIIGTNCGGSDPTSGLAANPTIGKMSDFIVELGGTSVLCETTELIGAEHILARRAKNQEVHDKIYEIIYRYEEHIEMNTGLSVREGNPSPGNMDGGLTTLEEKSLGCIHKGGSTTINKVYEYAQQLETEQGLVIMDTPGNDASSVAGIVAGGCQLVIFSTGRGTPTGHPIAPVVKITGNRETWQTMSDNLDIDGSGVIYGEKTMDEQGVELFNELVEIANGKYSKAEALGFVETAIARSANFV